jgi:quercetin dioxygenase-like cupin family protein
MVAVMGVQRWELGNGERRQAPVPNGPAIEIVIGADAGRPAGVLVVTVPAGGAMPKHDHGASETMLIPQSGRLRLVDADDGSVVELEPGVLATIPVGQSVTLENPTDQDARTLVVLTPPDFAAQLAAWPTA